MTALELIDLAREACDGQSWYRLAQEIGVKEGVLHGWRHNGGGYSDDAACELARILRMDPFEVIAIREISRERNEVRRNRWLERLGKGARTVSVILGSSLICHLASVGGLGTSQASSFSPLNSMTHNLYYVN